MRFFFLDSFRERNVLYNNNNNKKNLNQAEKQTFSINHILLAFSTLINHFGKTGYVSWRRLKETRAPINVCVLSWHLIDSQLKTTPLSCVDRVSDSLIPVKVGDMFNIYDAIISPHLMAGNKAKAPTTLALQTKHPSSLILKGPSFHLLLIIYLIFIIGELKQISQAKILAMFQTPQNSDVRTCERHYSRVSGFLA